jgi:hypothetical protein
MATFLGGLLPPSVRATIPPLYSTEGHNDPLIWVKFFTPDSSWTWYVFEAGPVEDDTLLYCLVDGFEAEFGYVLLSELEAVRGPDGLKIERDIHWSPCPLLKLRGL